MILLSVLHGNIHHQILKPLFYVTVASTAYSFAADQIFYSLATRTVVHTTENCEVCMVSLLNI
jgi:hypothetical protein